MTPPETVAEAVKAETALEDLPDPELTENARTVLPKRYLKKDVEGNPTERPKDMFWRVARVIAAQDARYGASREEVTEMAERFYRLMASGMFEPNSPTLMNAGRPLGQLSACFVLPVPDSLDEIYDTLKNMALIHQSGGGTGFGFSRLRPRGDVVKSTMGVASGPVSFMEVYDASTEAVKQGGTRRGANMGILRVDHPDIMEFIHCKSDKDKITNFNISVGVTDAFIQAVRDDEPYELVNPRTGETEGRLRAREVFDEIVEGAWRNGEPGVFLMDEANRYNPVPHLGDYEATNPCGEQPLLPYDVCNLGSVNVGWFVEDGEIDWEGLRTTVHHATHFLDNVIDANQYPLEEIDDLSKRIRRIGLGVMGWADLLIRLGVPYGSKESIELGRKLMAFIDEEAKVESERLAAERGVFPEWELSIWGPDDKCAREEDGDRIRPMRRLRNCNLTTVAPTGTISIIAGCSGGIEPLYAVAFMRNQAGSLMPDVNDDFVRMAKEGGWYSEELMERIADEGHIHFDEVPAEIQELFVTAHDVTPEQHIRMQAAFQEHTDSAISKTCNFPQDATQEDVREIYMLAFDLDCKGVTVYRDGSRDEQVLSTGDTARKVKEAAGQVLEEVEDADELAEELASAFDRLEELEREREVLVEERDEAKERVAELESGMVRQPLTRDRPDRLRGVTRRIESPLGTMYVTINEDEDGRPFEVFVTLGKAGGAAMADAEAIGRLISLALRSGISMRQIHKQLRGISSDRAVGFGESKVLSTPDAIAQVLERYLQEKEGVQQQLPMDEPETGRKTNGGSQSSARPAIEPGAPGEGAAGAGAPSAENLPEEGSGAGSSAGRKAVFERYREQTAREFLGACPDCGTSLTFQEGCVKCIACGFSECG